MTDTTTQTYEERRAAYRAKLIEERTARAKARSEARLARVELALKVKNSPIKIAVEPLRADAMDAAEKWARSEVDDVRKLLEANGMDREVCAPYPSSSKYSTYEWHRRHALYLKVHKITRGLKTSRSMHESDPCQIDSAAVAKFITESREDASAQYEKFVFKLVGKIGECSAAVLKGNHVWSHSILAVTKLDGSVENWKTKQITNVSKLGKYFPQWPSRKVK